MRKLFSSGSPWESKVGYSRAIRVDNYLFISGTAATGTDGEVVSDDLYQQTKYILASVGAVLLEAGFDYADVVQSRLVVSDFNNWSRAAEAHGEIFGEIRPAFSLVHALPFIDPRILVEIELIAMKADH